MDEDFENLESARQVSKELYNWYSADGTLPESCNEASAVDFASFLTAGTFMPLPNLSRTLGLTASSDAELEEQGFIDGLISMGRACRGRQFFHTSGDLRGLSSGSPQPGDVLVVLFGGNVPFILREEGDHHKLVSACYVEGIVHGEAVRTMEAKEIKPTVFHIR